MNGVQTRLKCKPNVKRCKRFVFAAHSPLLHPNTLKTKAIIHFQTDHILTRFVFPPLVRAILDKYDGKLPPIHPNEMNKLIKAIGLLLGWTHDCGFDEKRLNPKRGRRFCDMLLSHTARRSFATNAYKAGVPLPSIQAITGHSSEAQLRRYLKLDAEEKAVIALKDFKGIIEL